jgi:transposase-like protein
MKDYHGPDDMYGPEGLVKQLSKALIERAMQAELTEQLGYEKNGTGDKLTENRRNGKSSKTLRTNQGAMEIEVLRDREGEFEPKIVPKHQREWRGFDDKILSMYGLGLSTKAIQENLKDIYNVDVSPELISRVTDEVKGLVSPPLVARNGGQDRLNRSTTSEVSVVAELAQALTEQAQSPKGMIPFILP